MRKVRKRVGKHRHKYLINARRNSRDEYAYIIGLTLWRFNERKKYI